MIREPKRIAVTESPGKPRVSMVVRAPPITPLLAVQVAASPSMEPFPYSWGFLESRRVWSQQMMEAISPPAPGMAPITALTAAEKRAAGPIRANSCRVGSWRPIRGMMRVCSSRLLRIWSKTSPTPKRPIMTGIKEIPSRSSKRPKVNRG